MKIYQFIVFFAFLFSFLTAYSQESEEILDYHSEVDIQIDGSLLVTENIKVRSTGNAIQRGIFRSFPVAYKDRYNNRIRVGFKVNEVTKDGKPEPYQIIRQGDYEVVRIGDEQLYLSPDIYDYTIKYETNRQVGFFEDFDELYWNAIGDQWDFKILNATARINLPDEAIIQQFAAYAGPVGSKDCPCDIKKESGRSIFVKVNSPLNAHEPLTLAVAWQKGIIPEPKALKKAISFFRDNIGVLILATGIVLALVYYLFAWTRVGKDPHRKGIYPLFDAPNGLEAAACRYIYKMGYDSGVFVSGIVELATKNALKIIEEKRKKFRLEKQESEKIDLLPAEEKIMANLFPSGYEVLSLSQKEHKKISGAMNAQKKDLNQRFNKNYFNLNHLWLLPGILISVAALFFSIKQAFEPLLEEEKFSMIVGLVLVIFSVSFFRKVFFTIIEYLDHGYAKISSVFGELFSLLFLIAFPILFIHFFDVKFHYGFLFLVLMLGFLNFLFFHLMKAPTVQGRKVMDELEGFRMYLNVAEKPILESYNPPGVTPEIFEIYLPYAIALGVGEAWGKAFENKLEEIYGQKDKGSHYHPAWYTGAGFQAASLSGFSKTLGNSFGAALSNSASPPGSKSGSGGGGRSGGGGGGGGGGGW